jgi:predicted RNA-binding protein with PIN domain
MLLIDGYNLLFKFDQGLSQKKGIKTGADAGLKSIKGRRDRLLNLLASFQIKTAKKIVIIFDNRKGLALPGKIQKSSTSKLEIIFTSPQRSADEVIIDYVRKSSNPKGIRVITSDNYIQNEIRRLCASSSSSEEFLEEINKEFTKPIEAEYPQKTKGISREEAKVWLKKFGLGQ